MSRMGICNDCKGTGKIGTPPDEVTCESCLGSGTRIVDPSGAIGDIIIKIDDIIAEQASQRADLTAALTQIWNKVKDL